MRLMQVHKSSSGDKPILPQPFDFSRYAGRQSTPLRRIDVKRREIWEWRDHTRLLEPGGSPVKVSNMLIYKHM